jgi:hypothetical protein
MQKLSRKNHRLKKIDDFIALMPTYDAQSFISYSNQPISPNICGRCFVNVKESDSIVDFIKIFFSVY